MTIRTYSELQGFSTFAERYRYLELKGVVGSRTFGAERYLNQQFYRSREWRQLRHAVIARDEGFDLGVEGYEVHSKIIIHHLTPLTPHDVVHGTDALFDMNNLITTCHMTHNAIHYGDESLLPRPLVERKRGDTRLW